MKAFSASTNVVRKEQEEEALAPTEFAVWRIKLGDGLQQTEVKEAKLKEETVEVGRSVKCEERRLYIIKEE